MTTGQTERDPVLRVAPRPGDINSNGHIFGGWVLSQMDIAAGIVASREAEGPVATVAIDAMEFIAPILLHDIVSVYAHVERIGRTSIAIRIEVVATRDRGRKEVKVTEGLFTFVALDENHRPRPVKRDLFEASAQLRIADDVAKSRGHCRNRHRPERHAVTPPEPGTRPDVAPAAVDFALEVDRPITVVGDDQLIFAAAPGNIQRPELGDHTRRRADCDLDILADGMVANRGQAVEDRTRRARREEHQPAGGQGQAEPLLAAVAGDKKPLRRRSDGRIVGKETHAIE